MEVPSLLDDHNMSLPFNRPTALPPSLAMHYATPGDCESLSSLHWEAFSPAPGNIYWLSPDEKTAKEWITERQHLRLRNPNVRLLVIKERETGELVAYARWILPLGMKGPGEGLNLKGVEKTEEVVEHGAGDTGSRSSDDDNLSIEEKTRRLVQKVKSPEDGNREAFEDFLLQVLLTQNRHDADNMLCLEILCTSPRFQRRGAARALMEPFLGAADTQGISTWLESTPDGEGFYKKLGFKVVDELEFDMSKGGREFRGTHRLRCMKRDSEGAKEHRET
ncbi:acyl-CoA N-acyltransferase [Xylariales sp. AK1849]|nr:acyl-CoA N-acyltransferase [Xylariales sp. AK1849]